MGGKVTVHDVQAAQLVLKVAGHSYSAGWGTTEYVPAHFVVLITEERIVLRKTTPTEAVILSFVHEFPVSASKG